MSTKCNSNQPCSSSFFPDDDGHYGIYGGRYAPEVLMPALEELGECFKQAREDKSFLDELSYYYSNFVGRPTPLYKCRNLSRKLGGAQMYIKNEGLCHTGAHKINHCVGQILLAKRMGKKRIIAETGAGQHGLATATVSAAFGCECVIYMGACDMERQRPNVFWMEQLGAEVRAVQDGGKRLKDAVNAALKDWIANVTTSHYLLGSCLGPHPFPEINRFFQRIVGKEIKEQLAAQCGKLPDYVIACVGGGSNSIGAFDAFLDDSSVQLVGVEAGGLGIETGKHAARFCGGRLGIIEGYKSYWLTDKHGQTLDTHSISAGLDYAGVGPFHSYLRDSGRVSYTYATDAEALNAFKELVSLEGVLPALESSHALAKALEIAPTLSSDKHIVVNISGRAEKDLFIIARSLDDKLFLEFLQKYTEGK